MALNLIEQHALAVDPEFVNRVEQAVISTAVAVSAEAPATVGHEKRAALAYRALHDSREYARKFAHGVPTQGGGNVLNDNEVKNTVAALWNAFAGVNPNA